MLILSYCLDMTSSNINTKPYKINDDSIIKGTIETPYCFGSYNHSFFGKCTHCDMSEQCFDVSGGVIP